MRLLAGLLVICLSFALTSCAPPSDEAASSDGTAVEVVDTEGEAPSHPVYQLPADGSYADTHPEPYSWAQEYSLIAHGLGGLGEHRVTNCFEAFEQNYAAGYRVFEVDLVFTSDGSLVARHDWEPYMYSFLGQSVDDNEHIMSLAEFEGLPIHGDNTPMSIEHVIQLLRAYPDIWIVTDTKSSEPDEVRRAMEAILEAIGDDDVLAERVIVQIYDEPMLDHVREVHEFSNVIYTLYQITGAKEDAARFAADNGVDVVTFPESMWSEEFMGLLASEGLMGAVHTVNDPAVAQEYSDSGVALIYSDFLTP